MELYQTYNTYVYILFVRCTYLYITLIQIRGITFTCYFIDISWIFFVQNQIDVLLIKPTKTLVHITSSISSSSYILTVLVLYQIKKTRIYCQVHETVVSWSIRFNCIPPQLLFFLNIILILVIKVCLLNSFVIVLIIRIFIIRINVCYVNCNVFFFYIVLLPNVIYFVNLHVFKIIVFTTQ